MRRFALVDASSRGKRMTALPPTPAQRCLASAGGLLAAISVGLAAYGAHGSVSGDRGVLQLAALFALGHGIALAALAPRSPRQLGVAAMAALLAGTLLFSGALATAQLAGTRAALAPAGGLLLIAGWLLHAIDAARR
jgi:uncharacterized membrane protein YgdD (TMEM256/DUF423 family)